VYLDSDTLVRARVDELFCHLSFAGSRIFTCAPREASCVKLNSGIMVIKPSQPVYRHMMGSYKTLHSWNQGDQGFLTAYYSKPGAPHRWCYYYYLWLII
jgi:alpha-N-acetylglucosamine transferase